MALNTEKYINVYYNKGDRKPYDVNGKPIAYLGQDFVGANEATIIRFNIGDDTGVVEGVADVKRPDGEKAFLIMSKVTIGADVFYELPLTAWHTAKVGKLVIAFKAFDGAITVVDGVIQANSLRVIVSDIFNIDIGYSPNSTEEAPPFDPNDLSAIIAALGNKLDKVNGINVVQALPTPNDNSLNGRWYLVKSGSPESIGKLYVFNNTTAVEVELGTSQFNFSTTGLPTDALTAGQVRYNDTTGSLDLGLKGDHVLKVGEVLVKRVRNDEASSLKVGQLVYVYGSVGNSGLLLVKKASNLSESNSSKTFGVVATAMNTTNAKDGYVYIYGLLQGVDLTDADVGESAFVAGDVGASLWLGENGKITKTLPTADNKHSVFVGYLDSFAGNGSNCGIYTKIQNGYEIDELHNVRISAVADNHILRYNSTRQVWENTAELTTAETDISNIEDGTTVVGKALGDQNGNTINTTYLTIATSNSTFVPLSSKGVANGVAPLGADNKIPSIHLPGGVDDIKEFANLASFPVVGESSIIYVALDTNKIYRWSGSAYVEISSSLALGTTASTAFPGDRGLATETQSNNIVSGVQGLTDTRITNSAVGTSPLIVNGIASTTANLQEIKVNNSNVLFIQASGQIRTNAGIGNISSSSNSNITPTSTGTLITRNIADTNPALIVRKNLGTGNILELQTGTSDKKFEVDVNGWFYQNGNRLFIQPVDDTNTFFGALSGLTTTTGTSNTAFGRSALTAVTSGVANTAVGNSAGRGVTTGSSNSFVGNNAGRTITTTSNNTFIGRDSGFTGAWGTQDTTVANSTGIGHQAVTDKSNQMVFGNASVSEFKFDRNASAVLLAPNIGIGIATPQAKLDIGDATLPTMRLTNLGTGIAQNTELGRIDFFNSDSSGAGPKVEARISTFAIGSTGIGGALAFFTGRNVSSPEGEEPLERMRIIDNGNVGIGTTNPVRTLSVTTSSNDDGIQIRRNSATTNDYAMLGFRINTTDNVTNFAEIRGVRTNRATSSDSDIRFFNRSSDALGETMRIRDDGLVGINETTFATNIAQLVVKSGLNTRVPLIIDSLTGHNTNLQEWRINSATAIARIDSSGFFRTNGGVGNSTSASNSLINFNSTGTLISRNVATSDPALIVNSQQGTSHIQVWQFGGNAVSQISKDGIFVGQSRPTRTDITANATLALADEGKVLRVNPATAADDITITIPKNSVVAFPIDTEIAIVRYNSGTVSIAPVDGDVTLQSKDGERKISGRYASVALKKVATDEWVLVGSLEA